MGHKLVTIATSIALLLALLACYSLKRDKNALIDLNHDKSAYIDAGCAGRFQGSEEELSGAPLTRDQMELQPQYY